MADKAKRLFEIYELAKAPKEVIIFTNSFKARGKLLVDKEQIKDEIITLMDAVTCLPFEKCQSEEHAQYHEWLNIFDKEILAFSVVSQEK